jgi:integrase
VSCLYRRDGARGTVYYGRVKRHGRIYMQKLAVEFEHAKKALRTWLSDVEQKAAAAATEGNSTLSTWGNFKDRYLRGVDLDVGLAEKSKTYRHECINRIIATWKGVFDQDIEARKITSITQDQCSTWAANITGYYVTTYNNTVATFKKVFEEAIAVGHLLASPAARLKRIGRLLRASGGVLGEPGEPLNANEREALLLVDNEEKRWYPTSEQFGAIVTKMRSYLFGPCQAAADFAELLAYTGCRLSEANRLRWRDVDWKKNQLRINGAKGRATSTESSVRYLPLSGDLAGLLRRLEKATPDRDPTDRIAKVSECRGTMQHACVDLEMPRKLDHHDLRHWFSSRAVGSGVPVPVVSDWLGHRDGGVLLLRTYRHEDEEENQKWAKKLKLS